jgi:hypothetical protein
LDRGEQLTPEASMWRKADSAGLRLTGGAGHRCVARFTECDEQPT